MYREFSLSWIVRDWLTDPAFVLFLLTLILGFLALRLPKRRRSSSRSYTSTHRPRAGFLRWLMFVITIGAFLFFTSPAIVNPMIASLEDRHWDTSDECTAESAIVILGGGIDSRAESADEYHRMSKATMARVARGHALVEGKENARVIVVGGALSAISEADVMGKYLVRLGLNDDQIVRENVSMSTWDNAVEVSKILNDQQWPKEIRLVTSALHMRRASMSFEAMNLSVCTVPVDRIALKNVPFWALIPQTSVLVKFDKLLHEWLGLAAYHASGKIS